MTLIFALLLITTLVVGFNIDPSSYNLYFCRSRFYISSIFAILNASYLILTSIDRVLITSRNAQTSQRSTTRLAYIRIVIITIFWSLFNIHTLFLVNIIQPTSFLNIFYIH